MANEPLWLPVSARDGHRWEMPSWPTSSDGDAVYWLPALGVPAAKYARWAAAMQARGVAVVVHEWRGLGSSSWRPSRRCDWGYRELLDEDIAVGLQSARSRYAHRRWTLGGHSLGGQLASLALAKSPDSAQALLLIATGIPAAQHFPGAWRWLVNAFARSLAPMTRLLGVFPGDHLSWAGREAGQVMRDWARSVLNGGYASLRLHEDIDGRLRALRQPALALRFEQDWLVPDGSLEDLLARIGEGQHQVERFDLARLGDRPDHFRWMRRPDAVADTVADWLNRRVAIAAGP